MAQLPHLSASFHSRGCHLLTVWVFRTFGPVFFTAGEFFSRLSRVVFPLQYQSSHRLSITSAQREVCLSPCGTRKEWGRANKASCCMDCAPFRIHHSAPTTRNHHYPSLCHQQQFWVQAGLLPPSDSGVEQINLELLLWHLSTCHIISFTASFATKIPYDTIWPNNIQWALNMKFVLLKYIVI